MIDGSGALFGTLQGNTREVLHKFTVDLPKKHGKKALLHSCLNFMAYNCLLTNYLHTHTHTHILAFSVSCMHAYCLANTFHLTTHIPIHCYSYPPCVKPCSTCSVLSYSGRGGQSALRFARLRMEKRHNYVRKVAETACQLYVSNDKVNVAGLVLAGSADFKTELSQSDMFDPVGGDVC